MEPSAVSENPDITSVDNDNSTHNVQITNHIIGQEQFSCNPSHIVIQERTLQVDFNELSSESQKYSVKQEILEDPSFVAVKEEIKEEVEDASYDQAKFLPQQVTIKQENSEFSGKKIIFVLFWY